MNDACWLQKKYSYFEHELENADYLRVRKKTPLLYDININSFKVNVLPL
uniref:Uncharacterized protein n=1 Tax=Lepeophtheirus salmonis TaxID=72036 RepID=A0A0K2UWG2_LEPSM